MVAQNYNEETKKLAMRVYTDKEFDCTELLRSYDGIDWLPVAQALCVRYFNREFAYGLHSLISSVIKYWKYEDEWLEEHESVFLVRLDESVECDWVSVFKSVLGRCGDASACIIQLPMRERWAFPAHKPSYDDMACRCWRDEDAEVIRMLLDAGAQIRDMDIKSNAVLCWCSPSVCDLVFERMGWEYASMDYSNCEWVDVIRTSGNLHAFGTVMKYAPDKIPLEAFNLNDLFREQRYEVFRAVLALHEDGSIKTPKAKSFLLDSAERGDAAAVELILKKTVFSKAAIKDIIATASSRAGKGEAFDIILREFGAAPISKPPKRSMTQCFKDAQIGAETADVSMIEGLAPFAEKMKPEKVVDLLERAAAYGNKKTIAAIFKLFGKPESMSSALCIAIRNGNEETARALRAKGASLVGSQKQWKIDGKYSRGHDTDTNVFVKSAVGGYPIWQFFEPVAPKHSHEAAVDAASAADNSGECCHAQEAVGLVRTLFESGALKKADIGELGFALFYTDFELAVQMFEQGVSEAERSGRLSQLIGTASDRGTGDVIDYAYRHVTQEDLLARFESVRGYITQCPAALAKCIRHLPTDEVKPTDAMWKALISEGYLDELKIVCSWTQCSDDDIRSALSIATELGKHEMAAAILEFSGGSEADQLALG